jgi:hypothetical protein
MQEHNDPGGKMLEILKGTHEMTFRPTNAEYQVHPKHQTIRIAGFIWICEQNLAHGTSHAKKSDH